MEQWKDVVGYEGLYEVSNLGRVRNIKTGLVLKPRIDRWGYYILNLHKNKRQYTHSVHRLVAKAWIISEHYNDQINHINEVKTDNRVDNLEWCTVAYNNAYGTHNQKIHNRYVKKKVRRYIKEGRDIPLW